MSLDWHSGKQLLIVFAMFVFILFDISSDAFPALCGDSQIGFSLMCTGPGLCYFTRALCVDHGCRSEAVKRPIGRGVKICREIRIQPLSFSELNITVRLTMASQKMAAVGIVLLYNGWHKEQRASIALCYGCRRSLGGVPPDKTSSAGLYK